MTEVSSKTWRRKIVLMGDRSEEILRLVLLKKKKLEPAESGT